MFAQINYFWLVYGVLKTVLRFFTCTCMSINPSLSSSWLGSAANFVWLSGFLLTCKKGYQWKGVTMIIKSNHSLPYSAYFWQETLHKPLSNDLIHSLFTFLLETKTFKYVSFLRPRLANTFWFSIIKPSSFCLEKDKVLII